MGLKINSETTFIGCTDQKRLAMNEQAFSSFLFARGFFQEHI